MKEHALSTSDFGAFCRVGRTEPSGETHLAMGDSGSACTGCLYARIGIAMAIETTYTPLRDDLASILDRVVDDQEVVIVRRRGSRDVALVPATELAGLLETAHLLRSPKNAQRLVTALRRAEKGEGKPETVAGMKREFGI